MDRRLVLFMVLSCTILLGYFYLMGQLYPPEAPEGEPPVDVGAPAVPDAGGKPEPKVAQQGPKAPKDRPPPEPGQPKDEPQDEPQDEPAEVAVTEPEIPREWVTLGSANEDGPYRMLVTLTNRGAAVVRIELNSHYYRDLEDRSGYLGHVVMDETVAAEGCPVQVVGPGTPADAAGLKPGDLIKNLKKLNGKPNGKPITGFESLRAALLETKPGETVEVTYLRRQKESTVEVTLGRRPLEVVRPETDVPPDRRDEELRGLRGVRPEVDDPLSFLLTLHQIDGQKLPDPKEGDEVKGRPASIERELAGLKLRSGTWEVVQGATQSRVQFRRELPKRNLEIIKTYSLEKVPEKSIKDRDYRAYHLVLDFEIRNTGAKDRKVAYQLDGPTGLPDEGWWYGNKIGRRWGGVGLRDVVVSKVLEDRREFDMIGCPKIAADKFGGPGGNQVLGFIGVDAQYFSAILILKKPENFPQWRPLRVGRVNESLDKLTNTSCRVTSREHVLKPGGKLTRSFEIFVGPKRPDLLAKYDGLGDLVYYGWFTWLAVPMVKTLHFFHDYVVFTYGLAILMLTVLVRGCMFPLSRKQALGAQKMQELQPEIKKIQEKYKKDLEARTKAQQDLFRKHNYNPLSGCLVLFLQLPIFIALYRSLMVDIELRQAPLLWEGIRWCSNLASPDMLFDWRGFMPGFVTENPASGLLRIFFLGPYFNLLPILTIALFIMQQKMFMPPPTDDQQAMQQKLMKGMMVFMGVIFFKVASGLCIYFIASSLWGLAERKLLPKTTPAKPADKLQARAQAKPQPTPQPGPQPKPQPQPTPRQPASSGDGAAARRKKKRKKNRGKR